MNLKNTPEPWQIVVLIALSFGGAVLLIVVGTQIWPLIGGGFPSLAASIAMVAAIVAFLVCIDRRIRRYGCVSTTYLDIFKGCWGIYVAAFVFMAAYYSVDQYHYLQGLKERRAKHSSVVSREKTQKKDSVTHLSSQQIQKCFGKAVVAGNEYSCNLYRLLLDHEENLSEVEAMCIKLPILENMFADEIFLDVDSNVVMNDFVRAFKERYDRKAFLDYCSSLYGIRQKLDYPPYILENPLGRVVNPSRRALAKAFPDKNLRRVASGMLDALYNVDNIEQLDEKLKILVGEFNTKEYKYRLDFPVDQTSLDDNSEYISCVEALNHAEVDQFGDSIGEIITHLNDTIDFDAKCLSALALSSVDEHEGIEILGAIIESGEYSRYLYDVWENWRELVQDLYFGYGTTCSCFPNAYYFKIRNICVNTILRHIQEHHEDEDLTFLLCRFANASVWGGIDFYEDTFGRQSGL